jgi:hypothetical protein
VLELWEETALRELLAHLEPGEPGAVQMILPEPEAVQKVLPELMEAEVPHQQNSLLHQE